MEAAMAATMLCTGVMPSYQLAPDAVLEQAHRGDEHRADEDHQQHDARQRQAPARG